MGVAVHVVLVGIQRLRGSGSGPTGTCRGHQTSGFASRCGTAAWSPATARLVGSSDPEVAESSRRPRGLALHPQRDHHRRQRQQDLRAVSASSFKSDAPIALQLDHDEKQNIVTVTILKPKVAFFTLNPAGEADTKRFDSLVIDVHAEPSEVREVCDKASSCARFAEFPALAPKENERSLTACQGALSTIRQELAAARRAIPTICR
jgi:hypothetical protein